MRPPPRPMGVRPPAPRFGPQKAMPQRMPAPNQSNTNTTETIRGKSKSTGTIKTASSTQVVKAKSKLIPVKSRTAMVPVKSRTALVPVKSRSGIPKTLRTERTVQTDRPETTYQNPTTMPMKTMTTIRPPPTPSAMFPKAQAVEPALLPRDTLWIITPTGICHIVNLVWSIILIGLTAVAPCTMVASPYTSYQYTLMVSAISTLILSIFAIIFFTVYSFLHPGQHAALFITNIIMAVFILIDAFLHFVGWCQTSYCSARFTAAAGSTMATATAASIFGALGMVLLLFMAFLHILAVLRSPR